ncbi:hypothetical protein SPWS13_1382 [Shewanella putrefaciens]|nr:hypothetical protein SPWS13_1382 [Shewanella putrefaciens]
MRIGTTVNSAALATFFSNSLMMFLLPDCYSGGRVPTT